MKCPVILKTEQQRLQALSDHGLDKEASIENLDPVVRIAARMFNMPVAAVNMVGSDHVFFAASVGTGESDMRRDVSFCAHAINQSNVMVVPDASQDERFHDNPLVTGPAQLRFYAGVPLRSPEGLALGALCVIDHQPRFNFSEEDQQRLQELAQMVSDRLELRRIVTCSGRTRPDFEEYAAHSVTPVMWFDARGDILAWNTAAAELHGYPLAEGVGQSVSILMSAQDRAVFMEAIALAVTAGSLDHVDVPAEVCGLRKDGSAFLLGLSLFSWKEAGEIRFEAVLKDLQVRHHEESLLHRRHHVDVLTGLANRVWFYHVVEDTLIRAEPAAVFMLDLDGFKDVNETLGHQVGDIILKQVAAQLSALVSPAAVVARIGGDEFAIIVPYMADSEAAMHQAHQVTRQLAQPMQVGEHEIHLTVSCGVALAPIHAQEALELVSDADLALFKAKASKRGQAWLFTPSLRMQAMTRRLYAMELYRAVDEGEFLLYYQPQVDLNNGQVTGAEALIRWRHPQRGVLAPISFLETLERGPLAATVGAWVLDEACTQLAYWRRQGASALRMGVNLFAAQFHTGNLVAEVIDTLARHGLPPEALELEITENIALDDDERVLEALHQLRAQGVGIAFDDFGTGYASLSLLKSYPLTRLKIDRSFVTGMLEQKQDDSVVCATLNIARAFELQTIAEGIENSSQADYLRDKLCMEGQGNLFGRAMPASQFANLIGLGLMRSAA
ncbi:MAG TPA: EAL domain-containing protein [Methylophilus sp.]